MAKNIDSYRRIKLMRFFVGTNPPTTRNERWQEMGHFFRGVQFILEKVYEMDGAEHVAEENCGYLASGSAQPSQNTIDDFRLHTRWLSGKKPIAFLCGTDQLWIFRPKIVNSQKFIDSRVSMLLKVGYDSPRPTTFVEFSGWLPSFEVHEIKNFSFSKGIMKFDVVKPLFLEGLDTPVIITTGT